MEKKKIGSNLIEIGEKFYTSGQWGIRFVGIGIVLATLICLISLIGYGEVYFFDGYAITAIGWTASILLISIGVILFPFFFFGLHYMGLGQICENTSEKKPLDETVQKTVQKSATYTKPTTPSISANGQWTCSCGRVNASYVSTCACGKNKRELDFN